MMLFRSIGGLTLLSCLGILPQNTLTNAFVTTSRIVNSVIGSITQPQTSRLFGKWESYDTSDENPSFEDALARNKARTDVKNFLTQRSIQSFIYLLDQCRDPHTVAWVEVSYLSVNMFFWLIFSWEFWRGQSLWKVPSQRTIWLTQSIVPTTQFSLMS